MPKKTKLPNLPSELIRVAVKDMELCEDDPDYRIDMGVWHQPIDEYNEFCSVCFAGSVMSKTLKIGPHEYAEPYLGEHCNNKLWSNKEADKFRALERFRRGEIHFAVELVVGGTHSDPFVLPTYIEDIQAYRLEPDVFKLQMLAIADELEECGL